MEFNRTEKTNYLSLPEEPGVYRFYNSENKIIYVGKAKNLKKRVSNYFTKKTHNNKKTHLLVKGVKYIETIVVGSELDALLLENNLIKEHQPKFNILLKDDKSFPSILVTNERFPRIFSTRRIIKGQGEYFGPYSNKKAMYSVLDLIRKLYTVRTCKLNLSEENIAKKKFKICLEYHLGNCHGPCEAYQSEEDYLFDISHAKMILRGKVSIVKHTLKERMNEAANQLNFENAAGLKQKIELLEQFQAKSLIVSHTFTDADVFTVSKSVEQNYLLNYLKINQGSIVNSETIEIKNQVDEIENILRISAFELRLKYKSDSKTILTNLPFEPWEGIEVDVPKIGDKKKIIDLSLRNHKFYLREKASKNQKPKNYEVLNKLQHELSLTHLPSHIECFDNSNIQGTNPVASMVCFKNGVPAKKDYRKYNIKTVIGSDDFSSMKEVVSRRYTYLLNHKLPLPNLIIIDGGKGQLNYACQALRELRVYGKIPVIGIAKKLEEIYFPEDEFPIHISKKSPSLKLIQKIRDEAHRFAITFHRQKRSKQALNSSLDQMRGIGAKTKNKLLQKFKTISHIKKSSERDLKKVIGEKKTSILLEGIKKGLL